MENLITIAEFTNSHDIKYNLLKDMLKQAGIGYILSNENLRTVEPFVLSPSNLSIEVKVYESDMEKAIGIIKSIA